MATSWNEVDIRCPYFQKLNENSISCEGITDSSTQIILRFASRYERDEHMSQYCDSRFDQCSICQLCDKKYDGKKNISD